MSAAPSSEDQVTVDAMITTVWIAVNSIALAEKPDPESLRAIGEIRDSLDRLECLLIYLMRDRHTWEEFCRGPAGKATVSTPALIKP